MEEEWREVVGYPKYRVSSYGNVIGPKGPVGFIATTGTSKRWVFNVNVGDYKTKRLYVHQEVLRAFVGPAPEGMESCHNDGDWHNNRLDNLRYDTKQANSRDRYEHGTMPGKLTLEQAEEIRALCAQGNLLQREIGAMYGVSDQVVRGILKNRTYKKGDGQ